jgi:hypothetical protein
VISAINKAVHARSANVQLIVYMGSRGTDNKHFRKPSIPTSALLSVCMRPDKIFAHSLKEHLSIKTFYAGFDQSSIINKELTSKHL